jgi:hypothetical protein
MVLQINAGRVKLKVRSSVEEICIAHTLFVDSDTDGYSADALKKACEKHSQYLLDHLKLKAGDEVLLGKILKFTAEGGFRELGPMDTKSAFVVFELSFELPSTSCPVGVGTDKTVMTKVFPASLTLSQNVLKGLVYAPGNPWQAVYVLRTRVGRNPYEVTLLQPNKEVVFDIQKHIYTDGIVAVGLIPMDDPAQNVDLLATLGDEEDGADRDDADLSKGVCGVEDVRIDVWRTVSEFLQHGVHHILEGWDHLLFISVLTLAALSFWDLIKVVSVFTLAHTVTLTLAVFDKVPSVGAWVEPMIAASIMVMAIQNIFWPRTTRGFLRLAGAFGFGLFHGLGFAGGLLSVMQGLPSLGTWTALGSFSFGVEIGHQIVVIPLFLVLWTGRHYYDVLPARVEPDDAPAPIDRSFHKEVMRYGSIGIFCAGTYYLFIAIV